MEGLIAKATEFASWDPCEETKKMVEKMICEKDEGELEKSFGSRVAFGTAGLRAEMGPGTSRLNDLVILQTAQGLLKYVEQVIGKEEMQKKGIVLGFDHRERGSISSKRFALLTAAVFLNQDVKVYLFGDLVATPLVPFGINKYGASCGVMVTASHNPALDDGFKVYWGNACQIISPHDKGIADKIQENLKPWVDTYGTVTEETVCGNKLCVNPQIECVDAYFEAIRKTLNRHHDENSKPESSVKVCYTAMHGVGHPFAKRVFEEFGFNEFVSVEKQCTADPTFPTVSFPNPEEKGALDLAIAQAKESGCQLVIANDPDADRLAVAELQEDGSFKVFTGNEIAALLGHWQWVNYQNEEKEDHTEKKVKQSKGAAVVASTVSSKFLKGVAEVEGFHFSECLTGFKFIGNTSLDLQSEGYDVIFSFEEAIGFCLFGVDKDGISALAVFAEMAGQLKKTKNKTCAQHLKDLEAKYGNYVSNNGYVLSSDISKNAQVFTKIRNEGKYLTACGPKGKYKIKDIRDLKAPGYDSTKPDNKPTLPVSSSNMITLTFENGCVCTLRMSGTEPKLKYYTEMCGKEKEQVTKDLAELVETGIRNDLLQDIL